MPYDLWAIEHWEEVTLHCIKCKAHLVGFPFQFMYTQGEEWLYDGRRIHDMILKTIVDHSCTRDKAKITEEEMINSGGITYDQFAGLVEIPKPVDFRMGQYVINTNSGHVWQIKNESDLKTVREGYKNGQRHVLPYE